MEFSFRNIILLLSVVTTALSAGLFFAWVISVIPGTRKVSDQAYLETMQSINREIMNPGFFFIFFGALIFLIINTYLQYGVKPDNVFYLSLGATLAYALGTIGVTMFGNVPLNNVVEALDLSKFSAEDYRSAREAYEGRWNNWNMVRTVFGVVAFLLILMAGLRAKVG